MTDPDEPPGLAETLLGTLARPAATFRGLAGARARDGAAAIALLGIFWGLFSFLLWSSGRSPHAVLLPIPLRDYYLVQGLVMLPVLTGLYWIYSELAYRLAGARGPEPGVRAALGYAYALPMLVHVGLESAVYLLVGFESLALVAALSLPLASLWVWALSARALRELSGASWPRAIGAAFAGLFVQAAAGALVLR